MPEQPNNGHLRFHAHAACEDDLEQSNFAAWLISWLGIEKFEGGNDCVSAENNNVPKVFYQVKPMLAPLSPLRERGCIVISERPLLVLCGDWAVGSGTMSGALISAQKTAQYVLSTIS